MLYSIADLYERLDSLSPRAGRHILLAIDGNSAAGKTTLAAALSARYGGNLFHMDDFFLQPEQRTAARLAEPGGNVDRERFLSEVLSPLSAGEAVLYRRFDCATQRFLPSITVMPAAINIIEGSYAMHPALRHYYDISVFLSLSPAEQMRRIRARNGEAQAMTFAKKWIPLENRYFEACGVRESCDFMFDIIDKGEEKHL